MSSALNQTTDTLSGLSYLENHVSKALILGAGLFLLSLPCLAVYKPLQRDIPPIDVSGTFSEKPHHKSAPNDAKKKNICVSKLLIHPIKSCRGISLPEVKYTPEGLENDRTWAIADATTNKVITAREYPRMVLITPTIHPDPTSPHGGILVVSFPEDSNCPSLRIPLKPSQEVLQSWRELNDTTLWRTQDINCYICEGLNPEDPCPSSVLSSYIGKPVNLLYKGPRPRFCRPTTTFPELNSPMRFQDGYPLLILSEESMGVIDRETQKYSDELNVDERWKQSGIAIERFRPNVIFSGAGPFAEDMWQEISINSSTTSTAEAVKFSVVSRCTRCLLPNVDINTGVRDAAVPFKVLMKFRLGLEPKEKFRPCVGCNTVPHGSGILRVGDAVTVCRLMQE